MWTWRVGWRSTGDVYLAGKGDHVVFAQREEINVSDDDHLVVALVKDGVIDDRSQIFLVAL
jgi:hypothetical protein